MRGHLFVISGPSGVGKGTLINEILPRLEDTALSRSATTRPMRAGEQEGREYFFLTPDEFDQRIAHGDFLEYVTYGSNRYGTLRSEVVRQLESGRNVVLEIELEGARNIKQKMPEAILVFISPPSVDELRSRLAGRNTEADAERKVRLERAEEELASQHEFDYIVVNKAVVQAAEELERLIKSSL
ncbi:MAG: guanylate kinase [Thermoleophilia bacterium]|nr:guanylate kinase [Thermoleophilia bacterium]